MKPLNQIGAILLVVFLAGCQLDNQIEQPTVVQPTETAAAEATTQSPSGISLSSFMNYSFTAPQSQQTVQLSGGKYEGGSGANYVSVKLLDQAAFGDLNGDGNADAALLLSENDGGSGVFVFLIAMMNQGNRFSPSLPVLIDDRPKINSISITDNRVEVDAIIHGTADAMSNPTKNVVEDYELVGNNLTLTKVNSTISGAERSILIDSPIDGAEASGSMQVKGSMPIGPFENTLAYRFYDQAGVLLIEGPFMVQSDGAGGAATFDNSVAIPKVTSGSTLLFVLTELSMADGSYLCLNSVNISVK